MSSHNERITILLVGGAGHGQEVEIYANSETARADKGNGMFDMYTRRFFDTKQMGTRLPVFAEKNLSNGTAIELLRGL